MEVEVLLIRRLIFSMVGDMVGVNYVWILIGKVTLHKFCWHGKNNSEFVR